MVVTYIPMKNIPSRSSKTKLYDRFRGVDFASAQSKVDDSRSPDAQNFVPRDGSMQKRRGWRIARDLSLYGRINGIYRLNSTNYLVHAGTKLLRVASLDGSAAPVAITKPDGSALTVADRKSMCAAFDEKLWLVDGSAYFYYDGVYAAPVSDIAYVPYTSVGGHDDGSSPRYNLNCSAGEALQPVNKISGKRKNTFITREWSYTVAGDTKWYGDDGLVLDGTPINDASITVKFRGNIRTDWYRNRNDNVIRSDSDYFFDDSNGAPDWEVEFEVATDTAGEINACDIISVYNNRLFFAGNPSKANTDWCSELNDPTYIPDLSYTVIGDSSPIMGYMRMGDYQVVMKADNPNDATVFLRESKLTEGVGDVVFTVKQGIAGNGVVSKFSLNNLVDDPLFLTDNGVFALASQYINAERTMQVRSTRVNPRLTAEPNLQDAISVIWDGFYIVCVNGHCYIADSRQRTYTNNTTNTFEYEWGYWTNIPARVFFTDDKMLYFGTPDGEICRFMTDIDAGNAFSDAYTIGAAVKMPVAIDAYWSTALSDDGSFMTYKTMPKLGCGVFLKEYDHSSAELAVLTDRDLAPRVMRFVNNCAYGFDGLEFEHCNFDARRQNIVSFGDKVRHYRTIQIIVRNNTIYEGFGFFGIERKIIYDKYAR